MGTRERLTQWACLQAQRRGGKEIMGMRDSLVRRAAEEFKQGRYLAALDLYRKLAERLGERFFHANITLCERMLRGQGQRKVTRNELRETKVACVMDEFTFHCYDPECQLLPLTPGQAIEELQGFEPDLLFIESAWQGKDGLWSRKIGSLSQELRNIVQWCKEHQVPTVFWNKEDPVHFETFLTTAQQFDFVFTTDIDCIARYKAALGHDRVYLLPFACQPKTHNPIELYTRKDAFCFAGAYYVRYPERTRDLETYVAEFPKFKPLEIFDRNFGKEDVNYQFPAEYRPYIVGTLPFNEIDKAYKGYRYSINLNSIKQSQTMFARRVFELLGSNTITVSNFSRGVRLMFGDLVIASDSGKEIVDRLQRMNDEVEQKLRLAALRKVMLEHTYEHRLGYVALKVFGRTMGGDLPSIVAIAMVRSEEEYRRVLESYQEQKYGHSRLVVVLKEGVSVEHLTHRETCNINLVPADSATELCLGSLVDEDEWGAMLAAEDYYGPNYLLDLALATRYSEVQVIGKLTRYQWCEKSLDLLAPGQAYQPASRLMARSSLIRGDVLRSEKCLLSWLQQVSADKRPLLGLAIDPFNYCMNGSCADDLTPIKSCVDDSPLDQGLAVDELMRAAEGIGPADFDDTALPKWTASRLLQLLGKFAHQQITIEARNGGVWIQSQLPDGKHEYIYCREDVPVAALPAKRFLETYLDASPGLNVQYVFLFLDEEKKKLGHVIHTANRNHSAEVPLGTSFVRIGWRIYGSGESTVNCLQWGHRQEEPSTLLVRSDTLLLTNHYPSYHDLYRNGFVHSRVKAYRERGIHVDVFRFFPNEMVSYHEFQNIDVMTGGKQALEKLLEDGGYRNVLVHFLSPEMWEVLERYTQLNLVVWVHGAEIQPWHRRDYNNRSDNERARAVRESELRMEFWRRILNPVSLNLKLVFVSRYFSEEVFEDFGFRVPEDRYSVIHNPIDVDFFAYEEKLPEQRRRILSIRPYASRTYANDLTVRAIIALSKRPFFKDLEFRLIGDGKLFEETLEPLMCFDNVKVERRFLSHSEIYELHKNYGVFLVPTRMDTQGVSRDEAMSSGLVPITNSVAAIPEFVDESCGFLAGPEDADGLANGIDALYHDPALFLKLSRAAAKKVRNTSSKKKIISDEIALFV